MFFSIELRESLIVEGGMGGIVKCCYSFDFYQLNSIHIHYVGLAFTKL